MTQKIISQDKSSSNILLSHRPPKDCKWINASDSRDIIDIEEILEYPKDQLPADAEFKGYEQVIIQDISLATDNILFRK